MSDFDLSDSSDSSHQRRRRRKQRRRCSDTTLIEDPLTLFSLPDIVRKHSAEIDERATQFEEGVQTFLFAKSEEMVEVGNVDQAREYIESREKLVAEGMNLLQSSKNVIKAFREENIIDRSIADKAHKEVDRSVRALLQERAALTSRSKVLYGTASDNDYAGIGEAYLAAIVESLPKPVTDSFDQGSFRKRILSKYNSSDFDINALNATSWCSVTKKMHLEDSVAAAHIVPYFIVEANAAYFFGLEHDYDKGYEAMWSTENGLALHKRGEEALKAARVVIVPDETDANNLELKLVVLDESILNRLFTYPGSTFRDVNNRRLEFKTATRPARSFLYLQYLLAMFRLNRERFKNSLDDVDGNKANRAENSSTHFDLWCPPGSDSEPAPWLRRSIIKKIAFELGDIENLEDFLEGLGVGHQEALGEFPYEVSQEKEANMTIEIAYRLCIMNGNEGID